MLLIKRILFQILILGLSLLLVVMPPSTVAQTKRAKSKTATKPNQQQTTTKPKAEAKSQETDKAMPGCTSQTHSKFLISASFSKDGSTLLSASRDGTVRLWDVKTGKQLKCFEFNQYLPGIAISPNNKTVIITNRVGVPNNIINVWDVKTGKQVNSFVFNNFMNNAFFLPNNYQVIINTTQYCLLLDLKKKRFQKLPLTSVYRTAFLANDNLAISKSGDEFKLIDVKTSKKLRTFKIYTYQIDAVAISPDTKFTISMDDYFTFPEGYYQKTLRVWEIETGKELLCYVVKNIKPSDFISKILVSKDNKYVLLAGGAREAAGEAQSSLERVGLPIYVFNIKEDEGERYFGEHSGWIFDISLSPDNKSAIYIGDDGIVRTVNIETGQETSKFKIAPSLTIHDYRGIGF